MFIKKQNQYSTYNESDSISKMSLNSSYDESFFFPLDIENKEINIKTNSKRDYQYKAVAIYKIGISIDKLFPIKQKILGKKGENLKKIKKIRKYN